MQLPMKAIDSRVNLNASQYNGRLVGFIVDNFRPCLDAAIWFSISRKSDRHLKVLLNSSLTIETLFVCYQERYMLVYTRYLLQRVHNPQLSRTINRSQFFLHTLFSFVIFKNTLLHSAHLLFY